MRWLIRIPTLILCAAPPDNAVLLPDFPRPQILRGVAAMHPLCGEDVQCRRESVPVSPEGKSDPRRATPLLDLTTCPGEDHSSDVMQEDAKHSLKAGKGGYLPPTLRSPRDRRHLEE
ncbi:hypothetical protein BC834DRAFT_893659 [Gloeopeniophorella convolvens]|nr:hypothetical protein BC834DRAFT_893659 [Gloeopeniophorella convolvens]